MVVHWPTYLNPKAPVASWEDTDNKVLLAGAGITSRDSPGSPRAGVGRRLEGRVTLLIVSHRRWPYGSEGCQAHGFQGFATALASICGSAAIAWGRYHHYCTRMCLGPLTVGSLQIVGG